MKFFTLILLLSNKLFAMETSYKWINKQGELLTGNCFEYDTESDGKRYLNKVKKEKCKTSSTTHTFYSPRGICLEIDEVSSGRNYLKRTGLKNCQPSKVAKIMQTINGKFGCYSVDSETLGKKYFKKLSLNECNNQEQTFYWKAEGASKGSCFIKNREEYLKVKKQLCRPSRVLYHFKRKNNFLGTCYELHPEGPQLYIAKVATSKCKPEKTIFTFLKMTGNLEGKCFEIDTETNGKNYINKVSTQSCK